MKSVKTLKGKKRRLLKRNTISQFLKEISMIQQNEKVILQKFKNSKFNSGRLQIIINDDYCKILNISKNEQIFLLLRHLYLYLNDNSTKRQVPNIETKIELLMKKITNIVSNKFNIRLKKGDIQKILLTLFS